MTVRELIEMLIEENHDARVVIDECDERFITVTSEVHEVSGRDGVVRLVKGDRIEELRS